jgi:hypothetical protein
MATQRTNATRPLQRLGSTRSFPVRRRIIATEIPAESRQTTLLLVRWGLAAVCMYFLIEGDPTSATWSLGLLIIAALAASNLALGRARPEVVEDIRLSIAIAVVDALLMAGAWYASGYESFTPVILSLCLLNLALVGVSLGEIATVVLAFVILYSAIGQID